MTRVASLGQSIAAQNDLRGVLRVAVDASHRLLPVDAAFGAVATEEGGFKMSAASGTRSRRFTRIHLEAGVGLGGLVAEKQERVAVDDYERDTTIVKPPELLEVIVGDESFRRIACVPVFGPDRTVSALLYIAMRSRRPLGRSILNEIETVAAFASIGAHLAIAAAQKAEGVRFEERHRLATELHDSVAQQLFAIGVEARTSKAAADERTLRSALAAVDALATQARSDLRATLYSLSRVPTSRVVESTLDAEAQQFEETEGFRVIRTFAGTPRLLGHLPSALLVDVLREGLRNVAKHSTATLVLVHTAYQPNWVHLTIQDDGTSTPDCQHHVASHGGLALLSERATQLGGTLDWHAGEDGGTVLRVEIPASGRGAGDDLPRAR